MKSKRGVSLIVLAISIIVMIILAGAVIINIEDTEIMDESKNAVNSWDISQIKEQLDSINTIRETGLEGKHLSKVENGTLDEIGVSDTDLIDKLLIENGRLVYRPEMVTAEEAQEFREEGIAAGTHIGVVETTADYANYINSSNLITIDQLANYSDKIVYLLDDITASNIVSIAEFTGVLNGNNYTISGITNPLFISNKGTIKNLTLLGEISSYDESLAGFAVSNYGVITDCINKVSMYASVYAAGIVVDNYESGSIINCSNEGNIQSDYAAAGIVTNNSGDVYNSCNRGNITGYQACGIMHYPHVEDSSAGKVKNCYNSGTIISDGECAGINIYSDATSNTYNIGSLTGYDAFGITLEAYKTTNSYAIKNVDRLYLGSGDSSEIKWIYELVSDGGTISSADKKELLQRLNQGNSTKVWVEDVKNINNGYPILYWQAQ